MVVDRGIKKSWPMQHAICYLFNTQVVKGSTSGEPFIMYVSGKKLLLTLYRRIRTGASVKLPAIVGLMVFVLCFIQYIVTICIP